MARRYYFAAGVLAALGASGFVMPSPVFGVFDVTPLLNVLHVIAGVGTAVAARRGLGTMRAWGQLLGGIFAALAITAFVADAALLGGVLPLTQINAWVHLAFALFFLYHALLAPPTV